MSRYPNPNQPNINRRGYFRLNLDHINAVITILGDLIDHIPSKTYNATIRDLSGGGISFYTEEPILYTQDDIVTATFEVLNTVFHEQVSFVRYQQENSELYFYACQFNNIDRREQDMLISIVFRLQANRK
jgi:c-di-GMP-binding flagellar brake protein YcgR